ncbi:hypothetical protein PROFUN_10971 [Planoprotostelium fungivorum]|uniref:Uncharacterized protein n=1 Tax=Planoprotostelium fungivorum TaxID=1890364 RepID=A0A2P6NBW5_9EUKA|nr:hypothetical protein PROFUN_10971 [Planoprotostelium fungivorum]
MQGSSPVTKRAFHFEDSHVLLANNSNRNTRGSLCHNLSCPTKRQQIQCTLTRDPRLGWCILVSSKEKEAAWLNNGQQCCKGELEETSTQSERTERAVHLSQRLSCSLESSAL